MSEGVLERTLFTNNPVSFITYNYDRLLEFRLTHGLMATYGIDVRRATQVLSGIQTIHLQGTIIATAIAAGKHPIVCPIH
jgi:hypothetical protein